MRPPRSAPGTGCRMLLAALALAALAACATTPAQQPQRTYDRIRSDQIYPLTREAFAAAGYKSEPCHAATVCVQTTWREYDGAKRGAAALRERRMYMARYERDATDDRYMLFLGVRAQERAPAGADWTDKQIDFATDAEYPLVLQALDQAVKRLGGVQY